jgi:hypothetical protein
LRVVDRGLRNSGRDREWRGDDRCRSGDDGAGESPYRAAAKVAAVPPPGNSWWGNCDGERQKTRG